MLLRLDREGALLGCRLDVAPRINVIGGLTQIDSDTADAQARQVTVPMGHTGDSLPLGPTGHWESREWSCLDPRTVCGFASLSL